MPNYCDSTLTITGVTSEQEAELTAHLESGKFLSTLVPCPDFNTIPNDDGELPVVETKSHPNGQTYSISKFPSTGKQDLRWRDWNNIHWNTKWDLIDVYVGEQIDGVYATFVTAWSPPTTGIQAVSALYPEATFTLTYSEDGADFAGVATFKDGRALECCIAISEFVESWFKVHVPNFYKETWLPAVDEGEEFELMYDSPYQDAIEAMNDFLESRNDIQEQELEQGLGTPLNEILGESEDDQQAMKEQLKGIALGLGLAPVAK